MRIALLSVLLLCAGVSAQSANDLASQVNPFVGTSTSWIQDNGNTLPGAVRPFGMLYWSPDQADGAFYRYEGTTTRGFSLTHLSGPGCSVYGDIPILPILGAVQVPPPQHPQPYLAIYKPKDQVAHPGYYAVKLGTGIDIQLAAALRSGIAEFSFPDSKQERSVVIDLSRNLTRVNQTEIKIRGRTITGSVESDEFCGFDNHYRIFFSLEVDQAPEATGTFDELGIKPGAEAEHGPRAGAFLTFSSSVRTVHLKVGISYVSAANAGLNVRQEIPGWNFQKVREEARAAWNEALGRVQIEGGTESQRRIFYTALYHSLLHPSIFSDVNGDYVGFDNQIHQSRERIQYANYSGWDIYRCQVQLITILFPKIASDMAQSLVNDAEQGGGLPLWPVANDESSVMVGDPSDLILASIYAFGGHNFDTRAALSAMLKGADDPRTHVRLYPERPGLDEYLRNGYIAQHPETSSGAGSAAVTLEDTSADFAVSQFSKGQGDAATAQRFLVRSTYWRNLFDAQTKYIRARDQNGKFLPEFSPSKTDGFVEGNSAQYTWMVPYDLKGVIDAVGGAEAAKTRLDDFFSEYGKWTGSGYTPHFFISNEPCFGTPWIYNWTGHSWRTQEVVQKTLQDLFTDSPGGLPGNDDLGATSSWAVFAFLGFYPEIPGVGGLTINTPTFPEVTLKLDGHDLHIRASGAPTKGFIRSVKLDEKLVRTTWLDWELLEHSSELNFTLSDEPVKEAGEQPPFFEPTVH